MSTKKATKRALLTSFLAICLCLVMLIGSTFAWFTDTASTGVNQIVSGNLDVALEMQQKDTDGTLKWVNAEGKTLCFRNVDGSEDILWEPGAKFKLDSFKIVNKGNLALKYDVVISGITGDAELLSAIDFTVMKGDNATEESLAGWQGILLPDGATKKANNEESGETSAITIIGKMKETAGNTYMNKTLTGIAITVNATQYTYENDSFGNTYDGTADMTPDNLDQLVTVNVTAPVVENGATTVGEEGKATVEVPAAAVKAGTKELTLQVIPQSSNVGNVTIEAGQAFQAYDISVSGLVDNNNTGITVKLYVGTGRSNVKVFHNTTELTVEDNSLSYDSNTGIVTFTTTSFSPFTVVYDAPAAMIGSTPYSTLADAITAAKDGDTVKLMKSTNGNGVQITEGTFNNNGLTIDFNGNTYTVGGQLVGSAGTGTNAFQLLKDNKITFKNGSIVGATENTKPAEDTPNWHGAPAIVIQNYCDLTLENMTVSGGDETVYTMSNNNGNIVINNTKINAGKAKGYTSAPMAFDVCRYSSYPSVDVTVKGSSVINGDVEVSGMIADGQHRQLTIENGTFNGKFNVSNDPANITIKGGTFSSNPTNYVDTKNCNVIENNGTWTVTAK